MVGNKSNHIYQILHPNINTAPVYNVDSNIKKTALTSDSITLSSTSIQTEDWKSGTFIT